MSQNSQVLQHLQKNTHITALEALGVYSIFRLAARIYDLRRQGHEIDSKDMTDARGKVYTRYSLVS